MLKTYKKVVLFLCVIVASWGMIHIAHAQMPVTIAPQLIAPYSLQLSSFYQGASPRLMVTLINNDLTRSGLQVKLRMSIKGRTSGIQITTNPAALTNTFVLQTGLPVQLSLNDFVKLFNANNLLFAGGMTAAEYQQDGILPEDIYDFCFEAFEANTGEKVSQQACAIAFFSFNSPPLLNAPSKGSNVKITEPANINFTWTPRHRPNPMEPTEYTFQIVEINSNVNSYTNNPEAAFAQSKILYQEKTSQTSLLWNATHPLLIPGKMYAWRVKAANISANEDKSIFLNGGYSEVSFFNAVPNCPELSNIVANTQPGIFSLTWTPVPGLSSYWVSYRKKGSNDPWLMKKVSTPNVYVDKLEAGTTYEYTISFDCGGFPVTSTLQTITIAKPVTVSGTITWKFNKIAYEQDRLPDSYEIPDNEIYTVDDDTELKGTATSVGSYGKVKLRFFVENELIDSLLLKTDNKGKYKAEFPKSVMNHSKFVSGKSEVEIIASIPGHTAPEIRTISYVNSGKNDLNGDVTLGLNTLHLTLISHINSNNTQLPENLSMEVFVSKSYYEEHLSFLQNKLATTSITYNGEVYVLLAKDESDKKQMNNYVPVFGNLPKLQSSKYLLRTICGRNVQYEQIDDTYEGQRAMNWWQKNQDKKIAIQKGIQINNPLLITGKVEYNGVAKAAQIVTLTLKQGATTLSQVSAVTDKQGKYAINIPILEKDNKNSNLKYEVMVRDANNRLNNVNAPTETITLSSAEKGMITKNFNFDFGRGSITGRVVDENKKPIANALVKVAGVDNNATYATLTTNKYGFFSFFVPGNESKIQLTIESEEIQTHTKIYTWGKDILRTTAVNSAQWKKYIFNNYVIKDAEPEIRALAETNPQVLGFHGNNYEDAYNHLAGTEYVLTQGRSIQLITLKKVKDYARFKFVFKGGKGKAKIEFPDNLGTLTGNHNEIVQILLPFKDYNLRVTEGDKETAMLPLSFTRTFNVTDTGVTTIYIEDFVSVSGIVSNSEKKPLQNAKVYIEGINREVLTDKNGAYRLVINKNEPYTLRATSQKHEPFSKAIQLTQNATHNITLNTIKTPEIKTLAGFKFTLTGIKASTADPEVYLISGSLIPPGNEVFSPSDEQSALTFENQPVKVNEDGNAEPTMNLRFKETEYSLKAFEFASVVLSDKDGIYMIAMNDQNGNETYAIGGITGEELTLKLKDESNISKTGLKLEDAQIRNSRHKAAKAFEAEVTEVVFVPSSHKINSLQKSDTFKVIMAGSNNKDLLHTTLGNIVPTTIVKSSGVLAENGLSFEGGISFPEVAGLKLMGDEKDYLKVKRFTFGKDYSLKDIIVNVDEKTPELAIQKIRAKLQDVGIYGIGTSNFGLSIGGYAYLKKPEKGSGADTLFINEFKFLKKANGISVAASFRIGGDGIGVKGLSFKQSSNDEISLKYDSELKSFKFAGSGKLNYKSKDKNKENSQSKFSSELFPIDIQHFEFATKDWSFLLMASANAKVSLGVAYIKISKLLVSIGSTGVSKDEMLEFLASDDIDDDDDDKGAVKKSDKKDDDGHDDVQSDAYQMVDESVVNWAIGFKGGLGFGSGGDDKDKESDKKDKKGISANAHASLLVANIDNKISVDVNEIGLGINSSAFDLTVKVKFVANDEKTGFEGEGSLTALGASLAAKFAYYKYTVGGIMLAADIKVKLPSPLVTLPASPAGPGPIQWYGIGGGFNFDTKEGKYMVEIRGDFNSVGMKEEIMLIKDGGIRIIFNTKCDVGFPAPELQIFGELWMLDKLWVKAEGSIDFCNTKVMLKVNGQVPIIPKTELSVDGLLLAVVDSDQPKNSFLFLGVNANVDILDGLLKGNAFVGLGVNVERDHRLFPVEEKNKWWKLIEPEALDNDGSRFNGVNLKAELELSINDSDNNGWFFNHEINVNAGGKVNLFFKIPQKGNSPELKLTANANLDINGYVQRNIGCFFTSCKKLNLPSINGSFNFAGGYGNPFANSGQPLPDSIKDQNQNYWYANGDAKLRVRDIVIIDGIDIDVDFNYVEGKKAEFNINKLSVDF